MAYAICSVPFNFGGLYPHCAGSASLVSTIDNSTVGNVFVCSSYTYDVDSYIECNGSQFSRELPNALDTDLLLNVGDMSYVLFGINHFVKSTNNLVQLESDLYQSLNSGTTTGGGTTCTGSDCPTVSLSADDYSALVGASLLPLTSAFVFAFIFRFILNR